LFRNKSYFVCRLAGNTIFFKKLAVGKASRQQWGEQLISNSQKLEAN
jgi:hypothetical protein